jgi:sporulation protein YlmC with PRC-barrel domain
MSVSVLKLSKLLELRVEDEDGRSLGHVHDVRVRRTADMSTYRVEGLIVGRRGLLVRLGWRHARDPAPLSPHDVLPWDHVVAIEPERLVVRRSRDRS